MGKTESPPFLIAIITNMLLKRLVITLLLFFCAENAAATENDFKNETDKNTPTSKTQASPWLFEAGISAGRPTPIMINAGIGYNNVFFRAQGGGMRFGSDDYWVGFRGSLAWKFFRELPFSLDFGFGGGYAFAKAPNGYLKALNRASGKRMVRSYNYKESLDISGEIRASIYGAFTQIGIPIHYFMKHDEPTVLWQVGYAYRF